MEAVRQRADEITILVRRRWKAVQQHELGTRRASGFAIGDIQSVDRSAAVREHTNNAAGALTRLLDLGVAPYLVASAVEAVLAQRLVRRVCPHCVAHTDVTDIVRRELSLASSIASLPSATGCAECRGTGYRGRLGIYELLVLDDGVRAELVRGCGSAELRHLAVQRGMRTLREDGARLVLVGSTTPDEVIRVTRA